MLNGGWTPWLLVAGCEQWLLRKSSERVGSVPVPTQGILAATSSASVIPSHERRRRAPIGRGRYARSALKITRSSRLPRPCSGKSSFYLSARIPRLRSCADPAELAIFPYPRPSHAQRHAEVQCIAKALGPRVQIRAKAVIIHHRPRHLPLLAARATGFVARTTLGTLRRRDPPRHGRDEREVGPVEAQLRRRRSTGRAVVLGIHRPHGWALVMEAPIRRGAAGGE